MTRPSKLPQAIAEIRKRYSVGTPRLANDVIVHMGEYVVPQYFSIDFVAVADADPRAIRLDVEVVDETSWRIPKVVIESDRTCRDVLVAGTPLVDFALGALAHIAWGRQSPEDDALHHDTVIDDRWDLWRKLQDEDDKLAAFDAIGRTTRQRRAVTRERLEQVARVYRDAVERGSAQPVVDVAEATGLSRSSAGSLVAQARRAGLLPTTTKGKAQA